MLADFAQAAPPLLWRARFRPEPPPADEGCIFSERSRLSFSSRTRAVHVVSEGAAQARRSWGHTEDVVAELGELEAQRLELLLGLGA